MAITLDGTSGLATPAATVSGKISVGDGSAAAPSLTNIGDSDTGLYFPAANQVAVALGGVQKATMNADETTFKTRFVVDTDFNQLTLVGSNYAGGGAALAMVANGVFDIAPFNSSFGYGSLSLSGSLQVSGSVGTSGQVLTSGGSGTAPSWNTVTGTGSVVRAASPTLSGTPVLNNATSGNGAIVGEQTFRLAADGAAIGPTISNYFGANSAISLEAASMYEITIHTFFLKTTAGTLTWTLTASSAPTSVVARNISTPILGTSGVGIVNTVTSLANAATAFAATGSLSTAVNHAFEFRVKVLTNLATDLRLNATSSAGTITPRAGSYYTVKKISASTGTFVA